ncbi:MAG TPA: hypothetical protein VGF77_00965 [Allosphingosinicella sp.]|jgi:hypothetical protein
MRLAAAFPLLLLAACGSSGARQAGVAAPGLECAVGGASEYGTGCTIARQAARDGTILILRSPTGSFRRLRIAGGRLSAADGAEPARLSGGDGKRITVAVGNDHYLIPREELR